MFCTVVAVVCCATLFAQIKGDPVFSAPPKLAPIQKSASPLSPVLQKLYSNTAARKGQPSGEKPAVPNDALDKFLQLKGDGIVVDITVKGDMAETKVALQQLGVRITGSFGRVISGIVPINALQALAGISSIQFAKPAYKPMHQSKPAMDLMQQCNTTLFGSKPVPVASQGDTAQRSYIARKKYNVNGKG